MTVKSNTSLIKSCGSGERVQQILKAPRAAAGSSSTVAPIMMPNAMIFRFFEHSK